MKLLAVALPALFLAGAAVAQSEAPAPTPSEQTTESTAGGGAQGEAQAETPADPNRRVCRRVETNTGSRVPFRTICLTERQWQTYRPN